MRDHLRKTGRDRDPHQLARIGEAAIAVETARLWVERAAVYANTAAIDGDRKVAYVNLARLAVERAGLQTMELAQRSIGLAGFMRGHPLEQTCRDLATYLRQPAPDQALANGAAFALGSDARAADIW
ncbi:MAG: acyl-CoA dehydrogenase family protein, partial [Dongiaceae bacterium]